jgi:hypothetical protein
VKLRIMQPVNALNKICGCSSAVERLLAKEEVEGSNPFARSG